MAREQRPSGDGGQQGGPGEGTGQPTQGGEDTGGERETGGRGPARSPRGILGPGQEIVVSPVPPTTDTPTTPTPLPTRHTARGGDLGTIVTGVVGGNPKERPAVVAARSDNPSDRPVTRRVNNGDAGAGGDSSLGGSDDPQRRDVADEGGRGGESVPASGEPATDTPPTAAGGGDTAASSPRDYTDDEDRRSYGRLIRGLDPAGTSRRYEPEGKDELRVSGRERLAQTLSDLVDLSVGEAVLDPGSRTFRDTVDRALMSPLFPSEIHPNPLSVGEGTVVVRYFGLTGEQPASLEDIAVDMGQSPAAVSELLAGGLTKLVHDFTPPTESAASAIVQREERPRIPKTIEPPPPFTPFPSEEARTRFNDEVADYGLRIAALGQDSNDPEIEAGKERAYTHLLEQIFPGIEELDISAGRDQALLADFRTSVDEALARCAEEGARPRVVQIVDGTIHATYYDSTINHVRGAALIDSFGLDGSGSSTQISVARSLGKSREAVSRLINFTVHRLRENLLGRSDFALRYSSRLGLNKR